MPGRWLWARLASVCRCRSLGAPIRPGNGCERKSRRRLDKIRVGAYLAVMDKVGEWYEVDVNGWHGFVKDANVTLDAPLPD